MKFHISDKVKSRSCVIGGFIFHFTLGTIYTFGNMSPYVASYLRMETEDNWVSNGHMVWVFSTTILFIGFTMALGGLLERKIGARITCLIGGYTMSLGTIVTFFTIKKGFWYVIMSYGMIVGAGTGLGYSVAIATPIKWFPKRKGFITSIVTSGYGLGALLFNIVQSEFINFDNISPNSSSTGEKYFTDQSVLKNVPYCFILDGCFYAFLQTIAIIMLTNGDLKKLEENLEDEKDGISLVKFLTIEPIRPLEFTVKEAVKDGRLWLYFSSFALNGMFIVTISSLYKSFGQTFISNDRYFSIVGSIASLFNCGGRLAWGRLLDNICYRKVMSALTIASAFSIGTFYFCSIVDTIILAEIMYCTWVFMLFFCLSGSFAIFPAIIAQCFGNKNMAVLFGIVYLGYAISGLIGAMICTFLLPTIQYRGEFIVATVSSIFCLCITQFYPLTFHKSAIRY